MRFGKSFYILARRIAMNGLKITYLETHEAQSVKTNLSSSRIFAPQNSPVKILIKDENGLFIPCNFRAWVYADKHFVCSGNFYVPAEGNPIKPENLIAITEVFFESSQWEDEDFHTFISDLMSNRKLCEKTPFIRYNGFKRVELPVKHWRIFGIRISRKPEIRFAHSFHLCRLCALPD